VSSWPSVLFRSVETSRDVNYIFEGNCSDIVPFSIELMENWVCIELLFIKNEQVTFTKLKYFDSKLPMHNAVHSSGTNWLVKHHFSGTALWKKSNPRFHYHLTNIILLTLLSIQGTRPFLSYMLSLFRSAFTYRYSFFII